jgi:hypothetical protein
MTSAKLAFVSGLGLLGSMFIGCQDPASSPSSAKAWYGLARNACGPADGSAVSITFDTTEYAGCQDLDHGRFTLYEPGLTLDSLRAGEGLVSDVTAVCIQPSCDL